MSQIEYDNLHLEEKLQEQLDLIKRQDGILQQIEDTLHQMEQLAILSASKNGDWFVDRKQLQCQLEHLRAQLDQQTDISEKGYRI